jgi:hypothetical protein
VSTEIPEDIFARLLAPFEEKEIKFKPAVVTGGRALALPYVDARVVMDRLDDVVGIGNWQDDYEFLPDGSCICRLRLRINGEWIQKMDVGGESEQPDEGDRRKAALSDALKRAAVKFGVARYLYRQEAQWADYDAQKKKFVGKPRLPASAQPQKPANRIAEKPPTKAAEAALPATGQELYERLERFDRLGADKHYFRRGTMTTHVMDYAKRKLFPEEFARWEREHIADAVREAKVFFEEKKAYEEAKEKPVPEVTSA